MDNYIIGLLPTVTPDDSMKIAVSGGLHAITIGDLKAYINKDSGGTTPNTGLNYTFKKADGTLYTNTAPNMTNAELKAGFDVAITSDYTDPITWTVTAEGISGSYGNSGYNAHFTLDDSAIYDSGAEIELFGKIGGETKVYINFYVSG